METLALSSNNIRRNFKVATWKKAVLIALPILAFLLSFCCGRFPVAPNTVIEILWDHFMGLFGVAPTGTYTAFQESAVMALRFPRILLGLLVGAGLSVSGAALQGMFGNPLVSPQVLGVSSGAGFGAALAILLVENLVVTQISAVVMGLMAVLITFMVSKVGKGKASVYTLVLAGTITSAFFEALISAIKFTADPFSKLPTITYWLMGSLSNRSFSDVRYAAPLILAGIIVLVIFRWRINILSLDEDEAKAMGVNLKLSRAIVVVSSSVITAATVSVCGIVGWIGLVIPHICRSIVGPNHKNLIPACISVGGANLLVIDTLARSVNASEIPLSILTAIIGAPFFAYLLKKSGGQWK
jgi:iron complex transport system permease protein